MGTTDLKWDRRLRFIFDTDYNFDKEVQLALFLMAKKDVFVEYLSSLIRKDLESSKSPLLDSTNCGKYILNELGIHTDLPDESSEFKKALKKLIEDKKVRELFFDNEKGEGLLINLSSSNFIQKDENNATSLVDESVKDKTEDVKVDNPESESSKSEATESVSQIIAEATEPKELENSNIKTEDLEKSLPMFKGMKISKKGGVDAIEYRKQIS